MFGNFLEETCTGTGNTLALAGVTVANAPNFSDKYADGELVHYVVEDSGGTIRVGGLGAYVSATDDITRNDTWSWNGSTYDDSPATNITLSGGTHTVRCDALSDDLGNGGAMSGRIQISPLINEINNVYAASSTDQINYTPYPLKYEGVYDAFAFEVTAVTNANVKLGLYSTKAGQPDVLLAVHDTDLNLTTTGLKSASFDGGALALKAGDYFIAIHNEDAVTLRAASNDSVLCSCFGSADVDSPDGNLRENRTYGAMPDPAEISTQDYSIFTIALGLEAA